MGLYRVESGLIRIDDFNNLGSDWITTPSGYVSVSSNMLRLKHSANSDTMALINKPSGDIAIQAIADYFPTVSGDTGGLIVYENGTDSIEFLERYDSASNVDNKEWMAVSNGDQWDFYTKTDDGFSFIDSDSITANKIGFVLKSGASAEYIDLNVSRMIITKKTSIVLAGLEYGMTAILKDVNGNEVNRASVELNMTGVELPLPDLEYAGIIEIQKDGESLQSLSGIYYGGDIYALGSDIVVMWDGQELSSTSSTNIGSMENGVREIMLTVRNDSAIDVSNIMISISQYDDEFGYSWADIAPDVNGAPGTYSDQIQIPSLSVGGQYFMWLKVTKGSDHFGIGQLKFNIHIEHE